jgi:hypothetical protein
MMLLYFLVGAWEFYEKVRSEVKWDLSTILPPFVRTRLSLLSLGQLSAHLFS